MSKTPKSLFIASYSLIISATLVLYLIFLTPDESVLHNVGKGAGMIGFTMLSLQFVLSSRLKFIERHFGLDRMFVFHRRMAVIAFSLLLLHPILLFSSHEHLELAFFLPSLSKWQIGLGQLAFILLIVLVCTSLLRKRLSALCRLSFEAWRKIHLLAIAALTLAFLHSLLKGTELINVPLKLFWISLFGAASGLFLYAKVIKPLLLRRRPYVVENIHQETHDTWTVKLRPMNGIVFDYKPGQFIFLTLKRKGLPKEEHPFTISSAPTQNGFLTVTIKNVGDFTSTISRTLAGDLAYVEGPFGVFSFLNFEAQDLLFIAGGIGITPFMSMLRYMRGATRGNKRVTLLYGNKTKKDIVFEEELKELEESEANPGLKVVHVLSEEDSKDGETGYIDQEKIARFVVGPRQHGGNEGLARENLDKRRYFLCGPPPMMKSVRNSLLSLGVPSKRIHYERFALS